MSRLNGKVKRIKGSGAAAARTAAIVEWIEKTTTKGAGALKTRTSVTIAAMCAKAVGFTIPPRKMARELDRAGVSFLRTAGDPPKAAHSKTEYLRARQSLFEERLDRIEMKLFGKSF